MAKRDSGRTVEVDVALGRPGGEGTDPEPFGVALLRSAEGEAYVLPRSVGRLRGEAADVVVDLQRQARTIDELERRVDHLVEHARELGLSWAVVGWSVGITAEGARRRWSLD
jgi:hypothetical protein